MYARKGSIGLAFLAGGGPSCNWGGEDGGSLEGWSAGALLELSPGDGRGSGRIIFAGVS